MDKMWYEYEENFPALITAKMSENNVAGVWVHYYENGKVFDVRDNSYNLLGSTNWKLATEEEVLLLNKPKKGKV